MLQRSRLRALAVGFVVSGIAVLAACGSDAGGSGFSDADGGEGGSTSTGPGTGTIGGGNEAGTSGNVGDDENTQPCVGDACAPVVTQVCGDSKLQTGEQCDDGNAIPGDGCSGTCQIEPGYTCPSAGQACLYTVAVLCGNGKIEGNEACDDGNTTDGDGCSKGCDVEPDFQCTVPGAPCTPVVKPACGDGQVNFGEDCDDGNLISGDGCSATCKGESGFTCPTPGSPCAVLQYCGDGILQPTAGEECDDGNAVPGDGCSGICKQEVGYSCTTPGQDCIKIFVCGNGKVDPGEACDDSNTLGGDGCSPDCSFVEPGYSCPNSGRTGGACTKAPANTCGDGIVAGNEQCDDGNKNKGDGCSDTCGVEAGYTCPTQGKACTKIAFCGDGKINLDLKEACDDGQNPPKSGDGCSDTCQVETDYQCPTPGKPCVSTIKCGDNRVSKGETCDDGNSASGDGCSSSCLVENGYQCTTPGQRCITVCGDGVRQGTEQCDDKNLTNGDGCSSTCQLETAFGCTSNNIGSMTTGCTKSVCGNGIKEGFEQCDPGNKLLRPYDADGCSFDCTLEPVCKGGACTAVCGDGFKFAQEACDDGNTISGDGCSDTCELETGFDCTNSPVPAPASLVIPIVYRDFRYHGTENGHPDFNDKSNGLDQGSVNDLLDGTTPYGKPTFKQAGNSLTTADNYCMWYHDADCNTGTTPNTLGIPVWKDVGGVQETLTLNKTGTNVYQFSSNEFFPLTNLGWNKAGSGEPAQTDNNCAGHGPFNFSFTSELHYPFTYQGGEKFDFTGDDDVWVYINGHLAVDIGGVHGATNGSIVLSDTANNRCVNGGCQTVTMASLGLTAGKVYEIAMFQAERHTCDSNYTLTLSGFVKVQTQCIPHCGDGVIKGNEICDDGTKNDTNVPPAKPAYGKCSSDCKSRGPFCGDSTTQTPQEACDDGKNQTTYSLTSKVCGPGCQFAPYCGDGKITDSESCDDGTANNTGAYGKCSTTCTLGQRCGDGIKNGAEQFDHGINNGASADSCNANCTLRCGDGVKQAGEECDNGAAANTGGYGKCTPTCTLGPRCGDGIPNGTEQCDDGKNDGSYGTCKSDCTLANYCGDNTLTNPPETCDLGPANSVTAYGVDKCTNRCTPAPRCGDKAVDGTFGEVCDDGKNDGSPGSCTPDCKAFVANPKCGNGQPDPGEQCDNGTANNGQPGNACDAHCRNTCGNGVKDGSETCDNGVNDGSYGGCTSTCTIAGYCGDGKKNGPETCDNGNANQPAGTAYGVNICTTACVFAGYCGDGRIQSDHGEQCDGTSSCDATCKTTGPK